MSKKKNDRQRPPRVAAPAPDAGRRKLLVLGLGGAGALAVTGLAGYKAGWFDSSPAPVISTAASIVPAVPTAVWQPVALTANYQNALQASNDIVRHYARALNTPSALIHAVRAFGKNFTLADGANAVGHLCSKYAAEREVNGRRYVYFLREAEVHDNSFLKTMLEAGVSQSQQIMAAGNRYTLTDLGESAKALFRFDPQNLARFDPTLVQRHLPWGMIAFSILVPPSKPIWTNGYGESINMNEVIDGGLGNYERMCAGVHESLLKGEDESIEFRKQIGSYSCYGMHSIYGFFSCLNHGYKENKLSERLHQMFDLVIYRLQGDSAAIDREANEVKNLGPEWASRLAAQQDGKVTTKGSPPPQTIEVMRLRSQIKVLGHAFEALNYVQLHKMFTPSVEQKKRLQVGENLFYDYLVKMRAVDLEAFRNWHPNFVNDVVIATAHASRALKLLTPDNPDTVA